MPTVTLNKTIFEELVGKKLSLEELKDRISMLGTDLERIENDEIEVEIFPNRPDLLSEQGLARALSSFIGVKTGLREYDVKKSGDKVIVDPSVVMRPYTACAVVKKLTFDDERIRELMQMQEKLATTHGRNRKKSAYGIYPLKDITFPITYIAKDPQKVLFQPLGMDKKIPADTVAEVHSTGPKYSHIAAEWKKYPFFIDATGKIMSMLPYTNSHDTGKVDESTTEVFIECSGTDLKNVSVALNMFVTMFAEMGGEIYSLEMEYVDKTRTTPDLTPARKKLELPYVNKLLGLQLKEKDAIQLLEKMGYGFENGDVLIPAYRADILHQVDFVEDIAIAYGYENFDAVIPNVATIGQEDELEKFLWKIRDILIGMQFLEVKNYHLLTKEDACEKMLHEHEVIPLLNAVGEHNHLRNSLLPSILKNLHENQHNEYPQNLFEVGRTFISGETETGVVEEEKLSIHLCHEKADFTEIKQVVDALCVSLGLPVEVQEMEHPSFITGRVGKLIISGKEVGVLGEFSPAVLEQWEITTPTVGCEIDIEKMFAILKK